MEQALVFASIVLGYGLASELGNLNRLIRSKNVRWHWTQVGYAIFVLLTVMAFWWMIAGTQPDTVSLGKFLPIMWVLILLNLMCAAALPDEVPDGGLELREYYLENRRYLWALYALAMLPLSANWLMVLYERSGSLFITMRDGMFEIIPLIVVIVLMFARRWWLIALAYALLGSLTITWLSRTL